MNSVGRRLIVLCVAVLAVHLVHSCQKVTDIADVITEISGIVTDSSTGQPIDSARIVLKDTAGSYGIYTDTLGAYSLGFIGGGLRILVYAQKDGYATGWKEVDLSKLGWYITGVDYQLVPIDSSGL